MRIDFYTAQHQLSWEIQISGVKFEPGSLAGCAKLLPIAGNHFTLKNFTDIVTHHIMLLRSVIDHRPCTINTLVAYKFITELKHSYDLSDIATTG